MKEIVINDSEIDALQELYPDFSREQIKEIAVGQKEKIDFTKYTDPGLSPEQMREIRLALTDEQKKNITIFECKYFSCQNKHLSPFFDLKKYLLTSLLEEQNGVSYKDISRWASTNGQLQGRFSKICDAFIGRRKIIDLFDTPEKLPSKYAEIIKNSQITFDGVSTKISFDFSAKADVYSTFSKAGKSETENILIDKDTKFTLRNKLSAYDDCYYSLAVKTDKFWFAVAAIPNSSPVKSTAKAAFAIVDDENIYFDDCQKYIDTSLLVRGLRS